MEKTKQKRLGIFILTAALAAGSIFPTQAASVTDTLKPFSDVTYGSQYYEAARFLKNTSIIQGYADGSLGVEKEINRAEFVKIILEAQTGIDIRYDAKFSFPDVSPAVWYAKYVSTAKREGIVKGYPDGTFKPEKQINIPEAIKVTVERFGLKDITNQPNNSSYYFDAYKDQWFFGYLNTASSNNIYSSYYDLKPSENITRGESMDMLYRTLSIKGTSPTGAFTEPVLDFGSSNGLLVTNLKSPYRLPVNYQNLSGPLHIKIYQAATDNYLQARSSVSNNYWNFNIADEEIKSKMKLLKDFSTNIIEVKETSSTPYYYNYNKHGYIELPVTFKGLYYLEVDGKFFGPRATFLDVTDYSMVTRQGTENNLAWLIDDKTGTPVEGAKIGFYQVENNYDITPVTNTNTLSTDTGRTAYKKIAEILSSSDGTALNKSSSVNYIIAEKNGEISILMTNRYVTENKDAYKAFPYSDRPIYKPGDTVNFKAIVRKDKDGTYSMPAVQNVTLKIYNYSNNGENIVFEKKFPLSSFGSFDGSFSLSGETATGQYMFRILMADGTEADSSGKYFTVEAYKKDEYSMAINTDKDTYTNGDTITVDVEGSYYFGAPVANQKMTYTVNKQNTWWWPPCLGRICPLYRYYNNYSFFPYASNVQVTSGEGTLDADGHYRFSFKTQNDFNNDYYSDSSARDANYIVTVTTSDQSNIPVNATSTILVHGSLFNVLMTPETTDPQVGKDYSLKISTLAHDGKAYPNATLHIKVTEQTYEKVQDGTYYDYWMEKSVPYYRYDYKENIVTEKDGETDASGNFTLTFKPEKSAGYKIEVWATDSKGNKSLSEDYVYLNGNDDYSQWGNLESTIAVSSDKDNYEETDTAKFTIKNDRADSYVLLTLGKNEIIDYEVKKLTGKTLEYDIPLSTSMAPNITLYVEGTNAAKDMISGQKDIKVLARSKMLNVDVKADKTTTLPEDSVIFTVTTTDQNGNGAQADISFALVDKAIMALLNLEKEDLHWIFYQPRYFYLNYAATTKSHIEKSLGIGKGGGGTGASEGAVAPLAAPAPTMDFGQKAPSRTTNASTGTEAGSLLERNILLDTAYWVGSVQTDSAGKARVTVKLPHNLTTWIGTAIADTKDTKVGTGMEEIITTKNLVVSPFVPRFANEGDKMTLRVEARNLNVSDSSFTVGISGTGFSATKDTLSANITKGNGQTMEFPITVTGKDEMSITFRLAQTNGAQNDTLTLKIPVYPFGEEKLTTSAGEDNGQIGISAASGDLKNIRSIKLTLAPSIADNLVSSIEYLVGYPYGCVEQTMSRFLPTVVAYTNKDKLNFNNKDLFKDVDKQVNDGLQRLYKFQHGDGGWGWWENDSSTAKNTAYVMYGLTLAKKARFTVNENVYSNGLEALKMFYKSADTKGNTYVAYLGYVISLADPSYLTQVKDFSPTDNSVKTIDLAYAALTHQTLGHAVRAKEYLTALKSRATVIGDLAYFKERITDYEFMTSDSLSTAIALEAFAKIDVNDTLVAKIIRWFNINNRGYYNETHSTAHAVIALVDYLVNAGATVNDYTYEVRLNGNLLAGGRLEEVKELMIPASSLQMTGNKLTISKNGSGKLYYSFVQREIVAKDNISAKDNGFKIVRTYHDQSGTEVTGKFTAGESYRVNLKVTVPAGYFYTMITDNLAAGMEPVNPDLAKDSCYGGGNDYPTLYKIGTPRADIMPTGGGSTGNCNYYQGEYADHTDLLDNRTMMFRTNLEPGEHNFSYFVRTVTPGTYRQNPTYAEMMYAPAINGSSASRTVNIE